MDYRTLSPLMAAVYAYVSVVTLFVFSFNIHVSYIICAQTFCRYLCLSAYRSLTLWQPWPCIDLLPLLPLLFGIAFHLQLVLLSCHPIFLRPYHFLKLVSFLGANRTKSASVCLWLLRGAI